MPRSPAPAPLSPTSLRRGHPPEVLAPVGGRPQLAAAIENGADAVYFGLSHFNARARANNFGDDELPELMAELHERGVQGFVTLNTLVFDEELAAMERVIRHVADCRVDAVIVQDLGVAAMIRRVAPQLPVHGSTQMTVTSAESAALVARLGVERVVVGRELSVREVRLIAAATDLELEVFVHGALCVSYSGQCYSSEAWGGRSANRGQCAQACRLPYGLIVDGQKRPLGDVAYLLSPQDLMGVAQVPALIDAGVACLKIEGRLKGPEYVAVTTRTYREAVDRAWAGQPNELSTQELEELQQVFSRGLTPGFLEGSLHQRLVSGRFPKHRGVRVGQVVAVERRRVSVRLAGPVKAGDGLLFESGAVEEEQRGGGVYQVFRDGVRQDGEQRGGEVELAFGPRFPVDTIRVGDGVWRTRDTALEARLQKTWERPTRREPLDAQVAGRAGEPLRLRLSDPHGRTIEVITDVALQAASGAALDEPLLRDALGRLGDTPYRLGQLAVDLDGALFVPPSALKRLRRQAAVAMTLLRRQQRVRGPDADVEPVNVALGSGALPVEPPPAAPALTVLCRSHAQVQAALELPELRELIVDFLEVKGLAEAVRLIQSRGVRAVVASPRVLKPAEENLKSYLLRLVPDALLVRSLGMLHSLLELPPGEAPPVYGDFSLNAANRDTTRLLLASGLSRLAPTHDLNAEQLKHLARGPDGARLEVILHHHLPIFHTEHCVFARFLSEGDNKSNCGAPCERHTVHLEGRDGRHHLVEADVGCRNTVFNAEAQSGVRLLPELIQAGVRSFRLELVDHRADEVAPLVRGYLDVLAGRTPGDAVWERLRASRYGAHLGSLQVTRAPKPEEMKRPGWMKRG